MTAVERLAFQYEIRRAARLAHEGIPSRKRTAHSMEISPAVLEAFASFIYPVPQKKVAFRGLVKKLQQITKAFSKSKKLWEDFKKKVGVQSLSDLPRAIKELAKSGLYALQKMVGAIFKTWPLKLYTLPESKLFSFNKILGDAVKRYPKLQKWLQGSVKPKVDQFGDWLHKNIPVLSGILMLGVYIWIWLNVVEFEWDMQSLVDAVSGSLKLGDLLGSLPASSFGFLLNAFNIGTFTLLPATLAVRMMLLISKRYLTWDGGFQLDWDKVRQDFG